jgi:hypothetical protein
MAVWVQIETTTLLKYFEIVLYYPFVEEKIK